LDTPVVSDRTEIIANKVIKYFLTEKGSDLLNPEYGVKSLPVSELSESHLPYFREELKEDINRCVKYFKNTEVRKSERLKKIILKKLRVREKNGSQKGEIVLEVVTNKNNKANIRLWANSE